MNILFSKTIRKLHLGLHDEFKCPHGRLNVAVSRQYIRHNSLRLCYDIFHNYTKILRDNFKRRYSDILHENLLAEGGWSVNFAETAASPRDGHVWLITPEIH
ncbi:hypothetical protein CEXT_578901 [Caerostris extrusa]|uniref:Uncharacterized protein n=1 Tax=Caerostris extrusa TaxID=172846 RepID=A0AAV4N6T8_CAEEX|nr:hypothetical protein CEXT_578901 [Caerostris extrusa]